jgi:broad specificity phosphatase PhoE
MGEMEVKLRDWSIDYDIDGFIDIETTDTILERARLALEHIKSLDAESVLVVSHGAFGRALRSLTHPHLPFEPVGNDKTRFNNAEIVKLI